MKNLFALLLLFISLLGYSQTEIQIKAHALAAEYQTVTNATTAEMQNAEAVLTTYFTNLLNGTTIPVVLQNQVDPILEAITSGASPLVKSAHSVNNLTASSGFTINGLLTNTDPTFNRVFGTIFNPLNLCQTQGTLSGSGTNVFYKVYEFTVTEAGHVNIEVTGTSGFGDSYIFLYCSFDPLFPRENLIHSDDDGGSGLLSKFTDLDLPVGIYYLVVTTFSNGETGSYTVEVSSNDGSVALGAFAVPLNYWWIFGLFIVIAASVVIRRLI